MRMPGLRPGGLRVARETGAPAGRRPAGPAMVGDPRVGRKASGLTTAYPRRGGGPAGGSGPATGAPPADLGGQARPSGGGVDVGAYEGQ